MRKTVFLGIFIFVAVAGLAAASEQQVKKGDTRERVISLLGEPKGIIVWGDEELLIFDEGEVSLLNGKVSDVRLASREAPPEKRARRAKAVAKRKQPKKEIPPKHTVSSRAPLAFSSAGRGDTTLRILAVTIWLAMMVFMVATMWKIYTKAGQPGWGCLVPIYNAYLMLKIAGRPGWWLLLLFIPFVNWIIGIIVAIEIARNFGKGGWFAAGLIFLPVIFCPILAFGKAVYSGDSASA